MLKSWEELAITDAKEGTLTKFEFEELFQSEEWENVRKNVTLLKVPEGITNIPHAKGMFPWDKLELVILPESVTSIDECAFQDAGKLKRVDGGEKVKSIGDAAFRGCRQLMKVSFVKLESVGKGAFSDCESLKLEASTILPKKIEKDTFSNCKNLTNITIQPGTTEIAFNAFKQCEKLEKVIFGNCPSLIIDSHAFADCTKLQKLEIPSFRKIEEGAFILCNGLKSIVLGKGEGSRNLEGESFSTLRHDLDLFELHDVKLMK